MTSLLEVREVSSGYVGVQVLWGLSLSVEAGSLCCVLGPNGAGKTTLARTVTGALPSWSGEVLLNGTSITHSSPEARARVGVAHVPQGRRVFADMTVEENLEVARFAAKGREDPTSLPFVYELFPKLKHLGGQQAGRLSGGEQQMLAVGRSLMTEPRLLVMDEPSLGLAPFLVSMLYEAIARIRDRGVAVLLIEQVVEAALSVADTVAVLESGRVAASGPASDFRDSEALAAAYLGGSVRTEHGGSNLDPSSESSP